MYWTRIIAEAVAVCSLAALLYHYLGYPLVLAAAALFARRRAVPAGDYLPSVAVVVPCHDEEAVIAAKIGDLRGADYPADKVDVIVVSDGSGDRTAALAAAAGARVIAWPDRRGKPAALNAGAATASAEVLVFTDANARTAPPALRELVAPLADPRVGAVCGEQAIARGAAGEKVYWRYEGMLKRLEAATGSVVGADGSLYAIRRALYRPVPERRLIMDDFFISLAAVAAGYRLAYAPRAVAFEDALPTGGREFRRKSRIMAGSLAALAALEPRVFLRIPVQLFSHKILRWLGPAFLLGALAGAAVAAAAGSTAGLALLVGQAVFYLAGAAAWALGWRAPYHFILTNAALACGWAQYLFGANKPAWDKLR